MFILLILKKVIELSRKMSVDMSVIRTDFYIINGHPYFSNTHFILIVDLQGFIQMNGIENLEKR